MAKTKRLTQNTKTRFYTTDTGYRMAFDIQNEIDTGEDRDSDDIRRAQGTRQKQEVILELLEEDLGGSPQGVSPRQWVNYITRDHRLSTGQAMNVFQGAANQELLSSDPEEAHYGAATQRPIQKGDEPFGQYWN
jgi:hypothetical protein